MPPSESPRARWKPIAGYTGFALLSFICFLYLTFPYQAVRDRVASEAAAAGWTVSIGSLGPGLFGITARDVKLQPPAYSLPSTPPTGAPAGSPAQLVLSRVSARPALFPPGVAYQASAFGGTVSGSVGLWRGLRVSASANGLDAANPAVKALSGVESSGLASGELSFRIPRDTGPAARAGSPGFDLGHASGTITLTLSGALLKGGTATVPLYGQLTPIDLPRISLGEVEGKMQFENGAGKIEQLRAKSEDLEILGTGTVTLGRRVDLSDLNVEIKIKPQPELTRRLGMLGSALTVLPPDKTDPSFRVAAISGYLGSPRLVGFPR